MAALARWCFRRRAWVLAGWLALLVILGVTGRAAGSAYSDTLTLPGTGSTAALHLEEQAFPGHAGDQDTIVWRASGGDVRAPAVRARITAMLARVAAAPGLASVISPYSARGAAQVSRDGQIAYATVVFDAQANGLPAPEVSPRRPSRRSGPGPRPAGCPGRAGGRERAAALGRHQRGRWSDRRCGGAVHRVRLAAGHAVAAGGRDRRAGLRPDDGRAGLARGQHRVDRPDAGDLDRAGRGHRLRAVYRHPAPRQHQGRDDPPGRGGQRAELRGTRGPVRWHHGVHRPAGDAGAARRLRLRPGYRRGDHGAVHGGRRGHLAARAAGRAGDACAVPPGTPAAGR